MAAYEMIEFETHGGVGLIRLNRPKALNALCDQLMTELGTQLRAFDADDAIGAIVITGSERAFAAGADIKEMQPRLYPDVHKNDFISAHWEVVTTIRKPVIAAVAGFALSAAMIMSHIIASSQPPPSAKPATAAITGLRIVVTTSQCAEMKSFLCTSG